MVCHCLSDFDRALYDNPDYGSDIIFCILTGKFENSTPEIQKFTSKYI